MFEFMLSPLYFSTLLANLNTRNYVRVDKGGINTFSDASGSTRVQFNSDENPNESTLVLGHMGKKSNGSTPVNICCNLTT